MSDSDETERFEARVSSELVEAAGPWEYGEKKQLIEDALKQRAYGDGVVETEAVVGRIRDHLEDDITARKRLEREFSNFPPAAEKVREFRIEQTHAVARANRNRLTENEERIANRDADPEAASPGFSVSPAAAVEELLGDQDTLSDRIITEGPENPAVQSHAERCGMDPEEFWAFAQEELSDEAFVTEAESLLAPSSEKSVATDGGSS